MPREARYRAIARELGRRIESGELPPGERLPTEDALAERFGVHRLTARQAMVELRRAGLVETRHGLGSFVRRAPRRMEVSVDPVTRRHRKADLEGLAEIFTEGEEILDRGLVEHPVGARHLGVPGAEVYEITTLLRSGGAPCVLSRYRLRPERADLAHDPRLGVLGSLEAAGASYRYTWHAVSADLADPVDQATLSVDVGAAVLVREGLVVHGDEPLCHVERRCRGDLISFVTRYD
ncbi:GntR family transcriptional regulator [Streptosporangium carneum]|uniref:Transcriptional regulator n=1 Tax=Streptosporangium carneum TaxID=47481 RepID=A0A9W6I9R0_9ACTN|nr:GntR family transcriptional regulator [Streptosporangium carneum]GLK14392.1 transcriptional regulator [Streptosporangium carneum]